MENKKTASYEEALDTFLAAHAYETMTVSGGTFRYVRAGDPSAPTIVFLNGGMNVSQMWMSYVDLLSDHFQILIFDYPLEFSTNQELITGIHGFLTALHISMPVLAGASYGGLLAQLYIRRYPREISALILLSTGALDEKSLRALKRKYFFAPLAIAYLKHCRYEKLKPRLIRAGCSQGKNEPSEFQTYLLDMFTAIFRDYTREKDVHVTSLQADLLHQKPVMPETFQALSGRILLILPRKDFFSPEDQARLILLMQNPVLTYLEDGSHLSTILRPQYYASAIRTFLSDLDD